MPKSIIQYILELWGFLSNKRKGQFFFVLLLMFLSSILEVVSIGLVIPFLALLTNPEDVLKHDYLIHVTEIIGVNSTDQVVFILTVTFIIVVLLSGSIRTLLLYASTELSFSAGSDLSVDIYKKTLYQKYSVHIERNSSEVINGVIAKADTVIGGVFTPILTLFSATALLFGVVSLLLVIEPYLTIIVGVVFGLLYWAILLLTKKRLRRNSVDIATESTKMLQALQEGLKGIRDVIIDGSQKYHCNIFKDSDKIFRRAQVNNVFIGGSPRFVVETMVIIAIVVAAYIYSQSNDGIVNMIPTLGAVVLGAQKLLPALQQMYRSLSTIKGSHSSLVDVLNLLKQPVFKDVEKTSMLEFDKDIYLKNISFKHNNSDIWILKNISLRIKKGDCVGFVGETGSGKSTLLDVTMGLLSPNNGNLLIDNKIIDASNYHEWHKHIAHVPQNICLFDSSIMENIAFGVHADKVNLELVKKVAMEACISDFIDNLPDGYYSRVGESGVSLSGGQIQRIGIARALYKQKNILILDEATSALDQKTQDRVMASILNTEKCITLLIIAHRIQTLNKCNSVVTISRGSIENITYRGH
jgi:ATP-binding cassette, subfamily B, bacterial PglK